MGVLSFYGSLSFFYVWLMGKQVEEGNNFFFFFL
jgi:hypothetical protein